MSQRITGSIDLELIFVTRKPLKSYVKGSLMLDNVKVKLLWSNLVDEKKMEEYCFLQGQTFFL